MGVTLNMLHMYAALAISLDDLLLMSSSRIGQWRMDNSPQQQKRRLGPFGRGK